LIEEARRRHRHRIRLIAVGVILFALLIAATAFGMAGSGGGGGHSGGTAAVAPTPGPTGNGPHGKHPGPNGAHSASAAPTQTPPPSPVSVSTIPPTVAPAASVPLTTSIQSYNPWTGPGTLSPQFHVVGQLTGGTCTTDLGGTNAEGQSSVVNASIADPSNEQAFRCNADQGIMFDPCFAPPATTNVDQLACASSPYLDSDVYVLTLSQPLASSSTGFTPTGVWPLVLVLSNGDQCQVIQGTGNVVGQVTFNYGCNSGDATFPNTSTQAWTVTYLPTGATTSMTVEVTTAWE
jgi:hypothetical protein